MATSISESLLKRLILVEYNLRDIESDLIRINAKYPYAPAFVYKLGVELDCLSAIIDQLEQAKVRT